MVLLGCLARRQDRHGDAGHAGEFPRVVAQVNLPDLRGASDVHRAGGAGDPTAFDAPDVVGIDVQPHRAVALGRCVARTARAQGFGQHHAHTAMQQAKRLLGALIHRHPRRDEVVADLQELDA